MDADDNTVEVEITGNVQVKSLRPAGESAASGIPRDKLLIRIPEIKLNFAENRWFSEYKDPACGLEYSHRFGGVYGLQHEWKLRDGFHQ